MGQERRFEDSNLQSPDVEYMEGINKAASDLVKLIELRVPYCRERISARSSIHGAMLWVRECFKLYGDDGKPIEEYRD
jgi:hypothetical protein